MLKNLITGFLSIIMFISMAFTADKYVADVAHTNIGFSVKHMVISAVPGEFKDFSVDFIYDENDINKSSVKAIIKTASIDTDNEKRDAHLKSADFFDAEKYPDITFVSNKIVKTNNGFVAKGMLTIKNISKEIELPFNILGVVKDPWGNTKMGVESELIINRQDYNVKWNKTLDAGGFVVSNDVNIKLDVELLKTSR